MATDVKKIIKNLLEFYDFTNQTIISVGAGGGQLIEYGRKSKNIYAIDYDDSALVNLNNNLLLSGLEDKFTLIHSDFLLSDLQADTVFFEFSLHEMKDPLAALKHGFKMAPNILISDHWPGSEWAYIVDEKEKVIKSWNAIESFQFMKMRRFNTFQFFHDYEELYQKVYKQGNKTLDRIKSFKRRNNFIIPMSYGFALIKKLVI